MMSARGQLLREKLAIRQLKVDQLCERSKMAKASACALRDVINRWDRLVLQRAEIWEKHSPLARGSAEWSEACMKLVDFDRQLKNFEALLLNPSPTTMEQTEQYDRLDVRPPGAEATLEDMALFRRIAWAEFRQMSLGRAIEYYDTKWRQTMSMFRKAASIATTMIEREYLQHEHEEEDLATQYNETLKLIRFNMSRLEECHSDCEAKVWDHLYAKFNYIYTLEEERMWQARNNV